MARCFTLNVPAAGILLAWPSAVTIVLDPGPDEPARRHNLTREYVLVAGAVVLSTVAVAVLALSGPYEPPWMAAAGLLLGAWACHAVRPARRTVPAVLVDLLEPLRTNEPDHPGDLHRLVWEACDLIGAAARTETRQPGPARCIEAIQAQLRRLTGPTRPLPLRAARRCEPQHPAHAGRAH